MTIKSTELKMQKLKNKYNEKANLLVTEEVRKSLTKIKKKYNYDSIKMINGMGVSFFSIEKNGIHQDIDEHDAEFNHFTEIHEFLKFMAGEYNSYPSDVTV